MKHKLSNVLLKIEDHIQEYQEAYYRNSMFEESCAQYLENSKSLHFSGTINFLTYFNACSIAKWKQYTGIDEAKLHLELSGDICAVQFVGISSGDTSETVLGSGQRLVVKNGSSTEHSSISVFDLKIPETDKDLVGFILQTRGEAAIHNAYYFTEIQEDRLNTVNLALVTTTFKKEEYILSNIDLVKRELLLADDLEPQVFHMYVIDNGCTLDSDGLSDSVVTVLSNKNVGGSGGFARGMMEVLASSRAFTHILLMDDDVIVSAESIKRTYNLLRLAQGNYRNAFVNGGMIALEEPNLLYEDISFVLKSGVHHRIKGNLYIDSVSDAAKNESIDVEVPNAFGGWWFSCMPVSVIKEHGLPFPFFVRVDDVEYAIRVQATFMTMNGICVWHEGFEGRFKPSVDVYQYSRNFFIMIALDDCASKLLYFKRWERNVRLFLRTMEYDTVDLFLDALEDYLKGPDYIASINGEELMRRNAAKNEKFVSIKELAYDDSVALNENKGVLPDEFVEDAPRGPGRLTALWRTLPYDRHMLPDALLRDKPARIIRGRGAPFSPSSAGTKSLVVYEIDGTVSVRQMDKERYKAIMSRLNRLKKEYKERGAEVRAAYKAAKPWMTSWDFWNEYLGTDLKLGK